MTFPISLPEHYKIITVSKVTAANAAVYDVISCANALKVWFLLTHTGVNNTDLVLTLKEATSVGGSTTTAAAVPIWVNEDSLTTNDTFTRETTDAATLTVDADASANQLIVIEWDPAKHAAGYDCITLTDTGGHASNYVSCLAIVATRYPQATPPAVIS